MRVAERTTHDGGKAATVVAAPSVPTTTGSSGRQRRGVNREGLEAGRRSTRTLLWVLLAAAMVLYGFPFLYLLFT